jgi:arsenate reductase-like glutaredoxin family protein
MLSREDYEKTLSELMSVKNEEDAIKSLLKIVKGHNINVYKNDMYENPYFKALLPEVANSVIFEIKEIRNSLSDEINSIDSEFFKNLDQETIDELKAIKRDCVTLIVELDDRLNGLNSLI